MSRTRTRLVLRLTVGAIVAVMQPAFADCVIKPNSPPLPAGCVDVKPDCICDEQGQNCRWIFHCVQS